MSVFSQARISEKGDIQPLATWNRVVNKCWESETDDVKANIDALHTERIDQLRQESVDSPVTAEQQIRCVCHPLPIADLMYEALETWNLFQIFSLHT